MDRLEAMSLLIAVAEEGNLSAVSRRTGVPLSTVHRRVGDLEAHLGSRLLNRSTRHTELTEAGAAYVSACRRILEQVEDAERAVRGEYAAPRGELVMTAPIVFGRLHVTPLIVDFMTRASRDRYPARCWSTASFISWKNTSIWHFESANWPTAAWWPCQWDASAVSAVPARPIWRPTGARPIRASWPGITASPWERRTSGMPGRLPAMARTLGQTIEPRLTITTAEGTIAAAERGGGITQVLSYQVADALEAGRLETWSNRSSPRRGRPA